ncbi:protein kinase domain-containing protein [Gemmatimonas sp.]|uniref:protein kinase domain-containing protein n=1 Tax=Gemmatimonas sp. TaxID=1962908 RepID=UPI003983A85F
MSLPDSPERWRRIEAIFSAALNRDPEARASFVAMACDGDQSLAEEIHSLLDAHERSGLFDRLAAGLAPIVADWRAGGPVLEGRTIGRYEVRGRVGGGGMGVVHEAYDIGLERTVALKFLQAQFGADAVAAERFRQEARTVAALEHPNICTVHEIGETDDGLLYLVMPLYDGDTVQQRIARGPLPIELALSITVYVLRALAKAHARGIIHRDIKPSNVLFTADGVVKLLDFGIAKLADVTLTGTAAGPIGTLAYMSPEQALGSPLDHRTDLWSVGVMLYEMLTGQRPYANGVAAAMTGPLRQPLPVTARSARPEVTPELDAVVTMALARQAGARYQSASAFETAITGLGLASVRSAGGTEPSVPSATTGSGRKAGRWRRLALVAMVVAMSAATVWRMVIRPVASAEMATVRPSIAVLPFADRSDTRDQEYFADGITEELISTLSHVDGLDVASSTSVFALKRNTDDVRTIGRKLGVSQVVEGSLRRSGDQLRVTATLVNVADGIRIWSQQYDRAAGDAFLIQQQIAHEVARTLQMRLVSGENGATARRPAGDAYEWYLKGRMAWGARTEEGMKTALQFFEQAAQADSTYAPTFSGMADAYAVLGFYDYLRPTEAFPKAEAAARRAVALNPTLAAPHATLAYAAFYFRWDFARGEQEFKRAIELDDKYVTGHQWYGNLLVASGRYSEAVLQMRRAEQLDPLSLIAKAAHGWALYYAGEYGRALDRLQQTLVLSPEYQIALQWAGQTLIEMDSLPQAVAVHRRLVTLADSSSLSVATLAYTLATAGQRDEAERCVNILLSREASGTYVPSFEVAKVYAALGRPSDAFSWLEKARQQRSHSMVFLRVDPQLRRLRTDARFAEFVRMVLSN